MKNLLLILLILLFGCESNDNLMGIQEQTPLSREADYVMPGSGNQIFIVGGEEVDPACPNCKY